MANAKAIADEMRAFEDKLNDATIKADPNISPMIAKFQGGRQAQGAAVTPQAAK